MGKVLSNPFIPHPFLLIPHSFRIWNPWQETVSYLRVFPSCPAKQHSLLISSMGLIAFIIKDSFNDFDLTKSEILMMIRIQFLIVKTTTRVEKISA